MIRFKSPESEWKIRADHQAAAKLQMDMSLGYGQAMGPVSQAVSDAIAAAVTAGIKRAIEEMYTDEDFERDLSLRP
jgi:hypothetical protein